MRRHGNGRVGAVRAVPYTQCPRPLGLSPYYSGDVQVGRSRIPNVKTEIQREWIASSRILDSVARSEMHGRRNWNKAEEQEDAERGKEEEKEEEEGE